MSFVPIEPGFGGRYGGALAGFADDGAVDRFMESMEENCTYALLDGCLCDHRKRMGKHELQLVCPLQAFIYLFMSILKQLYICNARDEIAPTKHRDQPARKRSQQRSERLL